MNMIKSMILGSFLTMGFSFCASAEETSAPAPDLKTKDKTVALWNMKDFSNGELESKVEGGGILKASKQEPVPAVVDGVSGLRFKNHTTLNADGNTCSSLFDGPFSLRIKLCLDAPPTGALGGIFGRFASGKAGFRVMYDKDLKVSLDIPDSKGNGICTTPLVLGKWYDFEMRFDGTNAVISLNGVISSQAKTSIPKKTTEPIQIGDAAGTEYSLNGVIGSVELSKIELVK